MATRAAAAGVRRSVDSVPRCASLSGMLLVAGILLVVGVKQR